MAGTSLLQPAYPQPSLLAQPWFEVEVFPERAVHEAYALRVGACVQQDTVPDDPVSQERGGVVEDDKVDQVAADGAGHRRDESEVGVLERSRTVGAGIVDQDGDVDVAVRALRAAGPAPEQPGEAHGRLRPQAAREVVAQLASRCVRGAGVGRVHPKPMYHGKERLAYGPRLGNNT